MSARTDYSELLYDPNYAAFGVDMIVTPLTGSKFTVTAIDKTDGIDITGSADITRQVIKPAAIIRRSELAAKGRTTADLDDAAVHLNDQTWHVSSHKTKPNIHGEQGGEQLLLLEKRGSS